MSRSKTFPYKPHGIGASGSSRGNAKASNMFSKNLITWMVIPSSPFGTLLFNVPLVDDDVDESLEAPTVSSEIANSDSRAHETDMRINIENGLASSNTETAPDKRLFNFKVIIKDIERSKAHALKDFHKYQQHASLTDCLKCVQAIPRFVNTEKIHEFGPNHPPECHADNVDRVIMLDPISTLIHVNNKFWVCLGEVNGLQIDGRPVDDIFNMLSEETITVLYQMLGLQPATLAHNVEGRHDWRMYTMDEQSFTVM